jgi:dTMP kinase
VLLTREPGGAPGAERLRALLLDGAGFAPLAETLLHFAARAEHVARTIRPALAAGMWVICDRFFDSTLAYQGYGQGADHAQIGALAGMLGIVPDLTLVLDIPPVVAARRLAGRGGVADRYERLDHAFHARVVEGFREIARAHADRCVLIDADAGEAELAAAIAAEVAGRLGA